MGRKRIIKWGEEEEVQLTEKNRKVFISNVRNSKTNLSSKILQIFVTYDSNLSFETLITNTPSSVRLLKMWSTEKSFCSILSGC